MTINEALVKLKNLHDQISENECSAVDILDALSYFVDDLFYIILAIEDAVHENEELEEG
jgi:hypothetical protein